MRLRWAALSAVLALTAVLAGELHAQTAPSAPREAEFEIGQNYPNPVVVDTRIPFSVGAPPRCEEPSRLYRVTVRIYNLLSQLVATPVLQEGGGATGGGGQPLENVLLSCDRYVAYWDGKAQSSAQDVARGVYLYMLEVDGQQKLRRMFVRR